ncbi:hypothetical protein TWF696_009027 [Orbilia brochopaga]|uniref:C2H2-type domain-containing protein n=1 Tax=Orbilia brochopaga TaxID=3140254 RepID=A0AAV9UEM2_9PEZI
MEAAAAAAGFLYYSPDPQGLQQKQHGHHGQFLAQPNAYITASPQLLAPTPIHFPSQLVLGGRGVPLTITPSASPSLMEPYMSNDMGTESATTDLILFDPATPPLTHSAVSTPSIPYAMPTPISNHGWSSEEPLIHTVSLSDIQLPSTPMDFTAPQGLVAPSILKSNASPPPSISLNDLHCPALSPCSSQDSFTESDCCDPRELTIQSPTPVDVKPDIVFPPMPSLSGDDDEFLFGGNVESFLPLSTGKTAAPYMAGDYNEELSDLGDSEDDFIQNFSESVFCNKRMKFEDDSENEQLPSPPMSTSSSRQGSVAPTKVPKRKTPKIKKEQTPEEMSEEQRLRSFKFGSTDSSCVSSPVSPSEKPMVGHPISPHVIRRGRKQSLTEDPSKTFVCHLCTRRFRRQEHLKRHFRSLHTEDKPFSCGECGKRFSRSDNLTQHSRIHGTGAVVLGVLTEGEVPVLGSQFNPMEELEPTPSPQPLGIIVVDSMTAASGDIKDKSSEDKKSRKKRKRSDE